jgi:hypothetical protein
MRTISDSHPQENGEEKGEGRKEIKKNSILCSPFSLPSLRQECSGTVNVGD